MRRIVGRSSCSLAGAGRRRAPARGPDPPAAGTVGATTFLVTGRGYGHGVGMSQYGALGFAQNGATYDQILAHYYPGTELGPAGVTTMRVLLAESKRTWP